MGIAVNDRQAKQSLNRILFYSCTGFGAAGRLNRRTAILTKERIAMALNSRLTFRLHGNDLADLHRIAQAEGVSVSNAVRMLIRMKAPVTGSQSKPSRIWPFARG